MMPINAMIGVLIAPSLETEKGCGETPPQPHFNNRCNRYELKINDSSKLYLQAELHHPSRSGAGHLSEVARTKLCVNNVQIRVIKDIERFSSELHINPIAGSKRLEK